MAVFIVILDNASHQLNSHLVEAHPVASGLSMAKALPKNSEALEPPVKRLLAILSSRLKLSEPRRVLTFLNNDAYKVCLN